MRSNLIHVCAALVAVGSLAVAQEPKKEPKPPSEVAKPADTKAGEVMVHEIDHIQGLDLEDSSGKQLGDIEDLVLDSSDGSIEYAVIKYGGVAGIGKSERLVPWSTIKVSPKDPGDSHKLKAMSTLTEKQLEAAPAFDKDIKLDVAIEKRIHEAAGTKMTETRPANATLVLGHQIEKANVHGANDDKLGDIEKVMVDPQANYVGYIVFGHGGALGIGEKSIAMPWDKLEFGYDKDNKLMVRAPTLTKELADKAPEFKAEDTTMCCREYVNGVYKYYQCEPYWTRARP